MDSAKSKGEVICNLSIKPFHIKAVWIGKVPFVPIGRGNPRKHHLPFGNRLPMQGERLLCNSQLSKDGRTIAQSFLNHWSDERGGSPHCSLCRRKFIEKPHEIA